MNESDINKAIYFAPIGSLFPSDEVKRSDGADYHIMLFTPPTEMDDLELSVFGSIRVRLELIEKRNGQEWIKFWKKTSHKDTAP